MSSVTVGPRVQFDLDHYPRLRVYDPRLGGDRYVYLHRLTAYANGLLDDLDDDRHVHHVDGDRWNNDPANLVACDAEQHGHHHLNGGAEP